MQFLNIEHAWIIALFAAIINIIPYIGPIIGFSFASIIIITTTQNIDITHIILAKTFILFGIIQTSDNFLFQPLIFSRQLEAIGQPGDILFAISTSGRSKNILKAISFAHKNDMKIIFLTSKNFKKKINDAVIIKAPETRVDRIQEMHICIGHIFCEEIENFLA